MTTRMNEIIENLRADLNEEIAKTIEEEGGDLTKGYIDSQRVSRLRIEESFIERLGRAYTKSERDHQWDDVSY